MGAKWVPTAEYLRECFSYDPATGVLAWKTRPLHHFKNEAVSRSWNTRFAGKPAGCLNGHGRRILLVDAVPFPAHRLIWLLVTGRWPPQLDHKNGDRTDNRWENLREATTQENNWNRKRPPRDLPRGVRNARNRSGRFTAQAVIGQRYIYLGTFDTPEEAHAAWRQAVTAERGQFFRAD